MVRIKLCALAVAALMAWGLKHHYSTASTDSLRWMLAPTAHVVGATTGTTFEAVAGEGYVSRERLFVIEKSCAGVNFMIAAFAMLVFTVQHRVTSARSAAGVLVGSLAASYGAAVLVNATRIVVAMWLVAHPLTASGLTAAEVHRLEGITVYFAGLMVLYEIALWLERRNVTLRSWAFPLGCYYAVTLAVPFVNGAARRDAAFARHALIVLAVPLLMIAIAGACKASTVSRWSDRPFGGPRAKPRVRHGVP